MKPVWIVDDDESIRWVLEKALARENIPLRSFSNSDEVLSALDEEQPQVLVSDIRMPGRSGLHLLEDVKNRFPDIPIIIMTAYSDLDSAVSAFSGGAFEYLSKPFDLAKAVDLVKRAMKESETRTEMDKSADRWPEIIGQAPAMQDVFRAIGKLSHSNATVLVTESPVRERNWLPERFTATVHGIPAICRVEHGGDSERFDGIGIVRA